MATIGIFDSGIGGLSVYRELVKMLPAEKYLYYADCKYCPYGDKSEEFIIQRCRSITEFLLTKGAEVIVVACNTATGAAIKTLRKEYDIPFVGMEPAVKPAALCTKSGVIGVLATAGTLKASKYLDTRKKFDKNVKFVEHTGEGFVELVESIELEGEHAESVIMNSLAPLLKAGADTIVLGCTHYPFLKETIQRLIGPDIKLIDPAPAVAKRLKDILIDKGIMAEGDGSHQLETYNSGSVEAMEKILKRL